MLIEVEEDRMGNLLAYPVSERIRKRIARYLQEVGVESDGTLFLNNGPETDDFWQNIPPRHHRDLRNGWTIRFQVDPWEFANWYGHDTHVLFESGRKRCSDM